MLYSCSSELDNMDAHAQDFYLNSKGELSEFFIILRLSPTLIMRRLCYRHAKCLFFAAPHQSLTVRQPFNNFIGSM